MSVATLSTRLPRLGLPFNDFFEPWKEWMQDGFMGKSLTIPTVNITEDKANFNLSVAAPGLTKKDFKIDVKGHLLTISAEKEETKEEKEEKYARKEYNYTSFARSFTLPEDVMHDKIEAAYADGILKLTLPKNEKGAQKNLKTIAVK